MTRRLAFAVGDTAGHVSPALAIADAFRARFDDVDIVFFAGPGGPASRMVPSAGYDLEPVPASPIARAGVAARVAAVARVAPCFARALRALRLRGSRLVIGSGGYASGGVLLAARFLGRQVAVLEPNVELGLANRLLRRVAHRAYVAFPEAARAFPAGRAVETGIPVRQSATAPHRAPGATGDPARLLVMTGSRGDEFMATRVPPLVAALRNLGLRVEVLHQAGSSTERIEREYARYSVPATVRTQIDDMAHAYGWSTFAIARAGASTLAELALAGVPALLVPLSDAAADHQATNARRVAESGAALWMRESAWDTGEVAAALAKVLQDSAAWRRMAEAAHALARPNATDAVVDDCERLMEGRW